MNIGPAVESHYGWKGRLETAREVVLHIKSAAELFNALATVVKANHSYECPEIVALEPREMSDDYRAWWEQTAGQKIAP